MLRWLLIVFPQGFGAGLEITGASTVVEMIWCTISANAAYYVSASVVLERQMGLF